MKLVLAALVVVSLAQALAGSRAEAQTCTGNCTFPARGVILVGLDPVNGPAPDPAGAFAVTIRDPSTDEFGRAEFDLLGYAGSATPTGAHSGCARIVTEPPWLDITVKVAIYDLSGHNGLAVSDLSVLVSDVLDPGASYFERSDHNFNVVLQANDISHLVGAVLRGRSELGCSSLCP